MFLYFFLLAPEQWTMIPVPVKLFKLIINELGTLLESAAAGGENDDRDSDDVSIQAQGGYQVRLQYSSDVLNPS